MNQSLRRAVDDYWSAHNRNDEYGAYCRILLFGGADGYPPAPWRAFFARIARRFALWVEGDKWR